MKPTIHYNISPDRQTVNFKILLNDNPIHYSENQCFIDEFIQLIKHMKDVDFIDDGRK